MKKVNSILLLVAAFVAVLNLSGPAMGDVGVAGSWVAGTSHATEAGNNRVLVFIAHGSANGMSLTDYNLVSVTYGGQAMTKVMEKNYTEDSFFGRSYAAAFILNEAGIAAATSSTFVPTWKSTPSATKYASVFLKDTYQSTPLGGSSSGGSTTATVGTSSINTSYGDMVILGATDSNVAGYTLNNGFTEGIDQNGTNITGVTGHKSASGDAETPSATFSADTKRQAIIGFVVQAVPDPNKASAPSPADGAANVGTTVTLNWTPGAGNSFDVYFGTDPNAHNNAKVTVDTNSYSPPTLRYGTKYYWAVDCNDAGTIHRGFNWRFSTIRAFDPNYQVGVWRGFRTAAVSYTFDDVPQNPNQFSVALPMFDAYGYKITFYPVIDWGPTWTVLQNVVNNGHEVGSHTMSHVELKSSLGETQFRYELGVSQSTINTNITGQRCVTLALPDCVPAYDETITAEYYIAARHCQGWVEANTPPNFYEISSIITGSLGVLKTPADFNSEFASAAASGGWCVLLTHAVDGDPGYSPTDSNALLSSLQYLDARRSTFWEDTFGHVVRYIRERNNATVQEVSHTNTNITVQVSLTIDDVNYNYPITIRRPLPAGWPFAYVSQNGLPIDACVVNVNSVNYVMFDVVPDNGDVVLSNGYGDLTGDGIVDYNDLAVLHNLWLVSDCNQTANIDLGGDCIINFQEFTALAENWLKAH